MVKGSSVDVQPDRQPHPCPLLRKERESEILSFSRRGLGRGLFLEAEA